MKVTFVPIGWEDYLYWQARDRKILKKINQLIDDISRGDLAGAWSRRITDEHRLVYQVFDGDLVILSARYHYNR